MIGHTLGPYRIAELISRSARSEVYRAVDTSQDDRVVALKLVNPTSSGDPRYVARFRREAEKAATVVEPHIVPVHRYGAIDGRLFVDMQLVEGRTLGEILTHEGALAAPRIVALLGQVGAALDAAHAQGSVHGYLTPAGVMVTGPTDGRPEFAHLVGLGVAETDEPGTTAYTAPERSPARPAAPSADVYSLTCVLYELLTGARPHPDTGYSQRRPPPRPSSLRGGIPLGFDDVVARGMAKDPRKRFRSAGELAVAATVAMRTPPSDVPGPARATARVRRVPPADGAPVPVVDPASAPNHKISFQLSPEPETVAVPTPVPPLPEPPLPVPARVRWRRRWNTVALGVIATVAVLVAAVVAVRLTMPDDAGPGPARGTPPASTSGSGQPSKEPITERTLVGRGSFNSPDIAYLDGTAVLVIRDYVGPVLVSDLATGEPLGQPISSDQVSAATATSVNGRPVIITGGSDNVIRLWDLQTGAPMPTTFTGHTAIPTALAVADVNGKQMLVSAGNDLTVRRWDLATGSPIGKPRTGLRMPVSGMSVVQVDGRAAIVTAGADWTLRSWYLATGAPVGPPIVSHVLDPAAVTLPEGTAVLAKEEGTAYRMRNPATGADVGGGDPGYADDILPVVVGGRALLATAKAGTITLRDLRDGTPVGFPMTGHQELITSLTSVDVNGSTFLISNSAPDRSIRIWDLTARTKG